MFVPLIEVAVALGLLVAPDSTPPRWGVGALGFAFALGGSVALKKGLHVHCSCFGPLGLTRLGMRQLLALPVWLAVVALISMPMPSTAPSARATLFATAVLSLCLLRARTVNSARSIARSDRRALSGA